MIEVARQRGDHHVRRDRHDCSIDCAVQETLLQGHLGLADHVEHVVVDNVQLCLFVVSPLAAVVASQYVLQ